MKVAILGAGISGLCLAWYLKQYCPDVHISLIESTNRVGGWIKTTSINGLQYEEGARSMRCSLQLPLLDELQLRDAVIQANTRTKYLVYRGRLVQVPDSVLSFCRSPLSLELLRGALHYPFRHKKSTSDESISDYFEKRFGKRFVTTCIAPVVGGIYAADPAILSKEVCWPKQRGASSIISFTEGLELLPRTLMQKLQATIHLNTPIRTIRETSYGIELVHDSGVLHADFLFSTLTSQQLEKLLSPGDPLTPSIPKIPHTSLAVVSLGYLGVQLPLTGFGFLCGKEEELRLRGIVFDSEVFPQHNGIYRTRISVMLGGSMAHEVISQDEKCLVEEAIAFSRKYLQIKEHPTATAVSYAKEAIAAYPVGYLAQRERFEKMQQGRRIQCLGAGLYGVAITSCITHSQEVARSFAKNELSS